MPGNWGLIDVDTPSAAYTKLSYHDGGKSELQLVFSDEFNTAGRTFYPGDDPYWEAVDLHYWGVRWRLFLSSFYFSPDLYSLPFFFLPRPILPVPSTTHLQSVLRITYTFAHLPLLLTYHSYPQTNNLEWYSPSAITTKDGSLEITLSKKANHGLKYEGGMMSTWNKFCFTGGLIETAVTLPGANNVLGLWPAIWTMGNLGTSKLDSARLFTICLTVSIMHRASRIWCQSRWDGKSLGTLMI